MDLESASIGKVCPEIVQAWGPARKSTNAAMSPGRMNCFTDWLAMASAPTNALRPTSTRMSRTSMP